LKECLTRFDNLLACKLELLHGLACHQVAHNGSNVRFGKSKQLLFSIDLGVADDVAQKLFRIFDGSAIESTRS